MKKIHLANGNYDIELADNSEMRFYSDGKEDHLNNELNYFPIVNALVERVIELESKACPDPVVEKTVTLLRSRSVVGVAKYGTTLADNKLTRKQWMQHLLEELLDAANYIQADMQQYNENEKAMGLEYAKGFRDGWQEKRDRLSSKSVSSCGVLAQKSAHEFTSYDRQMNVAAAYRLRHFYNSEWAGTPWRIENGKIVYGNAELLSAVQHHPV